MKVLASLVASIMVAAQPQHHRHHKKVVSYPIRVEATAYCLNGHTATGRSTGYGIIATDPGVIRLHSHLYIPGYGHGYAEDTGSAIQGHKIDLWMTCSQAIQWGRRTVTIRVFK